MLATQLKKVAGSWKMLAHRYHSTIMFKVGSRSVFTFPESLCINNFYI